VHESIYFGIVLRNVNFSCQQCQKVVQALGDVSQERWCRGVVPTSDRPRLTFETFAQSWIAITGNVTPDVIHPYVGLVAFYDANGDYLHRCSGTLLSPTIF